MRFALGLLRYRATVARVLPVPIVARVDAIRGYPPASRVCGGRLRHVFVLVPPLENGNTMVSIEPSQRAAHGLGMARILVVEDDISIATMIADGLAEAG